MATVSVKQLIVELENIPGSERLKDIASSAAGRLKLDEDLRNALEERVKSLEAQRVADGRVNAALSALRNFNVNIRED